MISRRDALGFMHAISGWTMKSRSLLTAAEIASVITALDERLNRVGLESQPEIALKILDLAARPEAQLQDYAKVIKSDAALSGRLLKLSNSALFAQRRSVTSVDRACLLLGLERLKSISLGFHLSRAAASTGAGKSISREVWGQGVLRACVAAECARVIAPTRVAEAFVIGLMLDAGIPLMCRLVGDDYATLYQAHGSPGALFQREFDTLEFTHVDVMSAMARRWRFPELLAKPLEWHHRRPGKVTRDEPVHRLHRIAYVVGQLEVRADNQERLNIEQYGGAAGDILGISDPELARIVSSSANEYSATADLFSNIAASLSGVENLAELVQIGLVNVVDQSVEENLREELESAPARFTIGGNTVELVRENDGSVCAYLYDSRGQRLTHYRYTPASEQFESLCEALGVEPAPGDDLEDFQSYLRGMAA